MASSNFNDSTIPPTPGDDPPPIRFISELFSDPERAFAYLAIRSLGWLPSKFVGNHRGQTLNELDKIVETQLIGRGHPRALIRHVFQPLRNLLRKPPARGRSPGDDRPFGAYKLNAFFTIREEDDVGSWCRAAEALLEAARKRAIIGDPRFDLFWADNQENLVRVLHRFIRGHHTTPQDIAHSTWLAIRIGHDTGAAWNFAALLRIALDLYRHEPSGRGFDMQFLDDLAVDDARDDGAPRRHIPVYVKIAVLETLFDDTCLPHEIITFLCRLLLKIPPRAIVENCSTRTLFDLSSEIFALYLPRATVPEAVAREQFARFDWRLGSKLASLRRNGRQFETRRRLQSRIVGWMRLKDFFKSRNAPHRATEVGRWWDRVLKYLKKQAATPGTPLFLAILRWRDEAPDYDEDLE